MAAVLALGVGCGGDGGAEPDSSIMGLPDANNGGPPDAPTGGPPDASLGDNNDDFGQAADLPLNDAAGVNGVIQVPNDHDFYKFMGTAGQWLAIQISANTTDDPTAIDAVIQLYDASMTMVAENDDAVPRINTDSEIIIKLPTTGLYYVQVLEYSEWAGMPPSEGNSSFLYQLTAGTISGAATGIVEEPATDPGNDAATAIVTEAPAMNAFGYALGQFNTATDVDVYRITVPAMGKQVLAATMPGGPMGYGSTAAVGPTEIRDATGATVIARSFPTFALPELQPSLAPGNYLVYVTRPAGATAGANDFNVFKFFPGTTDNPAETEVAAGQNDTLATAQALAMMPNGPNQQGFILAKLTTNVDVDYFSFPATAGQKINVFCGSQREGSGVLGLKAEVRNAMDAVVGQATETLTAALNVMDAPASTTGTYYIRLTKANQDATVTGNWVRCGVSVGP